MLNNELFPNNTFDLSAQEMAHIQQSIQAACSEPIPQSQGHKCLYQRMLSSPVGPMITIASEKGLVLLEFLDTAATIRKEIIDLRTRYGFTVLPEDHSCLDTVAQQMTDYFAGQRHHFTLALDTPGTAFDETVWAHLQRIPYGRTCSYGDLASQIGNGAHARIVGSANHRNRVSIVIPCHRVIGADGSLTGYGGGLPRKRWLLEFESVHAGNIPLAE